MRGRLHPSAPEGRINMWQEEELLERGRRMQRELNAQQEEQAQRLRSDEERLRASQVQEEATLASKAVGGQLLVHWMPGNPKLLACMLAFTLSLFTHAYKCSLLIAGWTLQLEVRRRLEQVERQERVAAEQQWGAEGRLHEQQQAQQRDWQRREEDLRRQQAALDLERWVAGELSWDISAPYSLLCVAQLVGGRERVALRSSWQSCYQATCCGAGISCAVATWSWRHMQPRQSSSSNRWPARRTRTGRSGLICRGK